MCSTALGGEEEKEVASSFGLRASTELDFESYEGDGLDRPTGRGGNT